MTIDLVDEGNNNPNHGVQENVDLKSIIETLAIYGISSLILALSLLTALILKV